MLDTIVYIPTILAYAFIALLLVILCFIVIYISHKIFITIYDSLPLDETPISMVYPGEEQQNEHKHYNTGNIELTHHQRGTTAAALFLKNVDNLARKSKTGAMRIVVNLSPCYLAYAVFRRNKPSLSSQNTSRLSCTKPNCLLPPNSKISTRNVIIKYYNTLTDLPDSMIDGHVCSASELLQEEEEKLSMLPSKITAFPPESTNQHGCDVNSQNNCCNAGNLPPLNSNYSLFRSVGAPDRTSLISDSLLPYDSLHRTCSLLR